MCMFCDCTQVPQSTDEFNMCFILEQIFSTASSQRRFSSVAPGMISGRGIMSMHSG